MSLEDFQAGSCGVLIEGGDGLGVVPKKLFDNLSGLVTTTKPDHFWGRAKQRGSVSKV